MSLYSTEYSYHVSLFIPSLTSPSISPIPVIVQQVRICVSAISGVTRDCQRWRTLCVRTQDLGFRNSVEHSLRSSSYHCFCHGTVIVCHTQVDLKTVAFQVRNASAEVDDWILFNTFDDVRMIVVVLVMSVFFKCKNAYCE